MGGAGGFAAPPRWQGAQAWGAALQYIKQGCTGRRGRRGREWGRNCRARAWEEWADEGGRVGRRRYLRRPDPSPLPEVPRAHLLHGAAQWPPALGARCPPAPAVRCCCWRWHQCHLPLPRESSCTASSSHAATLPAPPCDTAKATVQRMISRFSAGRVPLLPSPLHTTAPPIRLLPSAATRMCGHHSACQLPPACRTPCQWRTVLDAQRAMGTHTHQGAGS